MIDDILKFNAAFVAGEEYRKFETSKFPDKKIAIVTCMDTRLVELLPAALGIRNGGRHHYKSFRFGHAFASCGCL